jgi:hypothetical protein
MRPSNLKRSKLRVCSTRPGPRPVPLSGARMSPFADCGHRSGMARVVIILATPPGGGVESRGHSRHAPRRPRAPRAAGRGATRGKLYLEKAPVLTVGRRPVYLRALAIAFGGTLKKVDKLGNRGRIHLAHLGRQGIADRRSTPTRWRSSIPAAASFPICRR